MEKSYIGMVYEPRDNSYSVNITSCSNHPGVNVELFLAGTYNSERKLCKIVSEPFVCNVKTSINTVKEMEMIMVDYKDTTSCVIFYDKWVINPINENGIPIIWDNEILC